MEDSIPEKKGKLKELTEQLTGTVNQLADLRSYTDAIIETVNEPMLILNEDLTIISASKGFYKKFNTTEAQTEGRHFDKLAACPWQSSGLIEKLSVLLTDKSSFSDFEIACNVPSIGQRIFMFTAKYLNRLHKNLLIVTINDITVSRLEKDELVENKKILEETMKLAVEAADLGTWEMNPGTGEILWDNRCKELFGIKEGPADYENFLLALHPDDREKTDEVVKQAMEGLHNGKYSIEYRAGYKNEASIRWIKANGRVYFDTTGNPTRFAGTVMDITRQKLNEELLRESEERFRLAADAAAALIWLSDSEGSCNYFNESWLQFTGRTFEQEKGRRWMEGVHPDDFQKCSDVYAKSFGERKEFHLEYRLRRFDGMYRWISDSGMPRLSPNGIFEGFIGTCMDVHDQKMTREELEKMVEDRTQLLSDAVYNLETSNHNLEEFAYVASHDLQEPLRKIQTFANRLEEKSGEYLSEDIKLYLSKITKASGRMSRLIGDLLNYSRLQKVDQPIETIDLNEVLANVLIDFDMVIQEKKAIIEKSELPSIKAIPTRMNQLFHNLISNALKFAKPTVPPVLKIYAESLPENIRERFPLLKKDQPYTMISVTDNGIGFNEEFAEKIFNIFQRLNGVGEYEGTGIGLAICRKIVSNQLGIIFAESKEDVGSAFRVILPSN